MSSYLETLDITLPSDSGVGQARQQVLADTNWSPSTTTSVSYVAASRILLVADSQTAEQVTHALRSPMQLYVAEIEPGAKTFIEGDRIRAGAMTLGGYLGRFSANLGTEPVTPETEASRQTYNVATLLGLASGLFDQVIDCSDIPLLDAAITPPGYHYVGKDQQALQDVVLETPELVGEFEKPKYFDYDPSICAHGRSGIDGCTRCLDACPTEAIISIGEQIEVNSYLCQGGGTCASSCPSGAITYRYPQAEDQIELVRRISRGLRSANGFENSGIALLFYDGEAGKELVESTITMLPEYMIPIEVEEIGSIGLDMIASSMAYGAATINILAPEGVPQQELDSLQRDILLLEQVFEQLDLDQYQVSLVKNTAELQHQENPARQQSIATYAGVGNKRSVIRSAVAHFVEQSQVVQSSLPAQSLALPQGSIFGRVILNSAACTLCMGCVSVCPASALEAGGEEPALKFIEANCVQCGICTRACPEAALVLEPRLNLIDEVARSACVLKREDPFRCIKCNKPFATQAMIKRMSEKLSGHWMFETPESMNRLKMCEDCRVADMYDRKDVISKT